MAGGRVAVVPALMKTVLSACIGALLAGAAAWLMLGASAVTRQELASHPPIIQNAEDVDDLKDMFHDLMTLQHATNLKLEVLIATLSQNKPSTVPVR